MKISLSGGVRSFNKFNKLDKATKDFIIEKENQEGKEKEIKKLRIAVEADSGKWVMLIKKLPTRTSPPKMSIFFSIGDIDAFANSEKKPTFDIWTYENESEEWEYARWILYSGERIRIFKREYSFVTDDRLKYYLSENAYSLVKTRTIFNQASCSRSEVYDAHIDEVTRPIYEQAILDGCSPQQAVLVANGVDVTEEGSLIPPIGWYRIRKELGMTFCSEEELMESK